MLPEQRHAHIVNSVKKNKYCSIQQLAQEVGVSVATIRRDLQVLAADKQIRLTRGGAKHVMANAVQEPAYSVKSSLSSDEKLRIGQAACRMVRPGETILLDTGTTVYQMVAGLRTMENVTVVTNDVRIASELAMCPGLNVCILGGMLRKGHYTATGFWTQQALESLHVDHLFLSCDAVDAMAGCSITNSEEILIKQHMINASNECTLLADHTKFESIAFMRFCPIDRVQNIITDSAVDPKIVKNYESIGVRMTVV